MDIYSFLIIGIIVGYLVGSIPFALVIGKLFYKVDVRNYGSGNLGSTNVARTLGMLPGIIVLVLDLLKGGIPSLIIYKIAYNVMSNSTNLEILSNIKYLPIVYFVTSFMACIGHVHPLFADFKGGKAVATICGFLLFFNWRLGLVGLGIYIIVCLTTKIVSLGSISAAIAVVIASIFKPFVYFQYDGLDIISVKLVYFMFYITVVFLALLLIYRHLANIKRMFKGEEKKFHIEKASKQNKNSES